MGLRLAQALVNVINGVLAADEAVEILLHQRLQLASSLAHIDLQVLPPFHQVRHGGGLEQVSVNFALLKRSDTVHDG